MPCGDVPALSHCDCSGVAGAFFFVEAQQLAHIYSTPVIKIFTLMRPFGRLLTWIYGGATAVNWLSALFVPCGLQKRWWCLSWDSPSNQLMSFWQPRKLHDHATAVPIGAICKASDWTASPTLQDVTWCEHIFCINGGRRPVVCEWVHFLGSAWPSFQAPKGAIIKVQRTSI